MKYPVFIVVDDKAYEIVLLPTQVYHCDTCGIRNESCADLHKHNPNFCSSMSKLLNKGNAITIQEVTS